MNLGDTDLPRAQLTGGSRSAAAVTAGIMASAEDLVRLIKELAVGDQASPLQGRKVEQLTVASGAVFVTDDTSQRVSVPTLIEAIHQEYLEGYGEWGGKEATPTNGRG